MQKSYRPCENSAAHQALPQFRGLWARRAEKIAKIRSPRDRTEHRIEFSHGLLNFCMGLQIGLPLRAGLHTGEIEMRGRDIGGIAVHAAARVMAQSQPDEVLVSRVVTDLVAGAGLRFSERGSHELKGLPGRWDLFSASL